MSEITFQALSPGVEQPTAEMTTGPSGLLLGVGPAGPVTLRLFRPRPIRLYLAVSEYLTWLLAFRAVALGAHLSVIAADHRQWLPLADTVRSCGGTVDVLRSADGVPGQGRAYRPSLIIDAVGELGAAAQLGSWQALASVSDPTSSRAISDLRACEMAMIAPLGTRSAEHLRRAYALSAAQVKAVTDLAPSEVILASVRRIARVQAPPSPTEHRLLFGG